MTKENLSAAAILAADDITIRPLKIPEWGGTIHIRTMTGQERDTWEVYAQSQMQADSVNIRARLAAICICDETGKRLFTNADTVKLSEKSGAALDRVYEAAVRLNGLSGEEVERIEKN